MDPVTLESLIVREIRKGPAISRRDLADRLGVARSTAGRRVDSLIERGMLREKGLEARSEAGRPRRLLELCGSFGRFAGFDFDARHLHAVLVDFERCAVEERTVKLPARPRKRQVLDLIRVAIRDFKAADPATPVLGYGVGVPGRVGTDDRVAIGYPYIAGWNDVDLAAELGLSPETLHIENNTRTIALGEYWLGKDGPVENLICLSVRTGISVAVISDGQLLRGHHEMAGEIRAWRILEKSGPGGCGKAEWLEDRATVRAITEGTGAVAGVRAKGTWRTFVEGCARGDTTALRELRRIATYHADAVARLVQLADPETVAVSGAFNEIGHRYLDWLREETASALTGHYFSPPPIRFVSNGPFTGALGAAALAAEHFRPAPAE